MRLLRQFLDPAVAVLLVLIGGLGTLVVSVPELRGFLALALGCGTLVAVGIGWHGRQSGSSSPSQPLEAADINISKVPFRAGAGGLFAALGSVFLLLVGLDQTRWFFAASLAGGVVLAALLAFWRRP